MWFTSGMTPDVTNDDEWSELLKRCQAVIDLEASAREHGAFERPRGVRSAEDLLRLALGHGPGGLPLRQAAAWAESGEWARLSRTALMNRLRQSADWLGVIAAALAARGAQQAEGLGERALRLVDGSALCTPGATGIDWRLHLVYDPVAQRFIEVALTDVKGGERLERAAITAGEIRIADRGFGQRADGLQALTQGPGDYLVRVTWCSLRWLDVRTGEPFDVLAWLDGLGEAGVGETAVLVGKARSPRFTPLRARLIALPLPPDKAEAARERARRASRNAKTRIQPGTLKAAGYVLLLTSLEAQAYPPERVGALYRLRWQVELAIKRLKSLLHIDRLQAKNPASVRAWLYAHLIAAFLIDDMVQDMLLDSSPCAPARGPTGPSVPGRSQGASHPLMSKPALAVAAGAQLMPVPGQCHSRPAVAQPHDRRHAALAAPLP